MTQATEYQFKLLPGQRQAAGERARHHHPTEGVILTAPRAMHLGKCFRRHQPAATARAEQMSREIPPDITQRSMDRTGGAKHRRAVGGQSRFHGHYPRAALIMAPRLIKFTRCSRRAEAA